ncbi:MAG: amidinotransferase [Prevotella sp.]|nr:amidinotransferase [Prevotella sp.]
MIMQTTNRVLMVRPVRFAFNEETAANNAFQVRSASAEAAQRTQQLAVSEFDAYVSLLRENGVTVDVLQDTPEPFTPDSIFPNNCFSTHDDGTLVVYPMFAQNRRREREKLLPFIGTDRFSRVVDLTHWEAEGKCLEGTGSLILDRERRMAYACLSPRTDRDVMREWAEALGYDYFLFDSQDEQGMPVYHTNVVMHVGSRMAVVCLDSVRDADQRQTLAGLLEESGKTVVDITLQQVHQFAGNMLEVEGKDGEPLLVMSQTARRSLTTKQLLTISQHARILSPDISAIEQAGGGSARCMLAEFFLK